MAVCLWLSVVFATAVVRENDPHDLGLGTDRVRVEVAALAELELTQALARSELNEAAEAGPSAWPAFGASGLQLVAFAGLVGMEQHVGPVAYGHVGLRLRSHPEAIFGLTPRSDATVMELSAQLKSGDLFAGAVKDDSAVFGAALSTRAAGLASEAHVLRTAMRPADLPGFLKRGTARAPAGLQVMYLNVLPRAGWTDEVVEHKLAEAREAPPSYCFAPMWTHGANADVWGKTARNCVTFALHFLGIEEVDAPLSVDSGAPGFLFRELDGWEFFPGA